MAPLIIMSGMTFGELLSEVTSRSRDDTASAAPRSNLAVMLQHDDGPLDDWWGLSTA